MKIRDKNIVNKKKDLKFLYVFKKFPIYQNCTTKDIKKDKFFDMSWFISKSTGVVQLKKLIPLKILYKDQHANSIGSTWKKHHISFADFIKPYLSNNVYEVGGSHGFLPNILINKKKKFTWSIIEPNPKIKNTNRNKNKNVKFLKSFFSSKTKLPKNLKLIVHSHVLEHIYDPIKFLKNINNQMNDKTVHCFSVPNLKYWLENCFSNTLDFEHSIYLTENIIERLLHLSNHRIILKKFYKKHSIFYATKKNLNRSSKSFPNDYDKNLKVFNNYVIYYKNFVKRINNKIKNHKGPIYFFGAHIFTQYLINFGINYKKINFILDNDPTKHNKRLYGTNMTVISPEKLKNIKGAAVILKIGSYQSEVVKQLKLINKKINIWK